MLDETVWNINFIGMKTWKGVKHEDNIKVDIKGVR
jgi:hypothetical protein